MDILMREKKVSDVLKELTTRCQGQEDRLDAALRHIGELQLKLSTSEKRESERGERQSAQDQEIEKLEEKIRDLHKELAEREVRAPQANGSGAAGSAQDAVIKKAVADACASRDKRIAELEALSKSQAKTIQEHRAKFDAILKHRKRKLEQQADASPPAAVQKLSPGSSASTNRENRGRAGRENSSLSRGDAGDRNVLSGASTSAVNTFTTQKISTSQRKDHSILSQKENENLDGESLGSSDGGNSLPELQPYRGTHGNGLPGISLYGAQRGTQRNKSKTKSTTANPKVGTVGLVSFPETGAAAEQDSIEDSALDEFDGGESIVVEESYAQDSLTRKWQNAAEGAGTSLPTGSNAVHQLEESPDTAIAAAASDEEEEEDEDDDDIEDDEQSEGEDEVDGPERVANGHNKSSDVCVPVPTTKTAAASSSHAAALVPANTSVANPNKPVAMRSAGNINNFAVPKALPLARGTVKDREERRQLPGWECPQCSAFYAAVGGEPPTTACSCENSKGKGNEASRHKFYQPPPQTPAGFWDLSFPPSQH